MIHQIPAVEKWFLLLYMIMRDKSSFRVFFLFHLFGQNKSEGLRNKGLFVRNFLMSLI